MLNTETERFIADNKDASPDKLRLKYAGKTVAGVDIDFAITQIECRQKAAGKLPAFLKNHNYLFPTVLSAEQATGEILADFHAETAGTPGRLLDITCGLGVDAMTFASKGWSVTACDMSEIHVAAARHNAAALGIEDFKVFHGDSLDLLRSLPEDEKFDLIFADPARRGSNNKRTFGFADCTPDIVAGMDSIRSHTDRLMVKASPMLDIDAVIAELPAVHDIWILSVRNECKEIVCDCRFNSQPDSVRIHTLNFNADTSRDCLSFIIDGEVLPPEIICEKEPQEGMFAYIPNASLMKVVNKVRLTQVFSALGKADANTHIYFSDSLIPDFPGRKMLISSVLPYNKKGVKELRGGRYNIVCRNFPDTPAQICKKCGVKEGGEDYLLCLRRWKQAVLLVCQQEK